MKIVLTGGGSGGHFYPLIAVAEKINEIARQDKLLSPEIFYLSNSPYDKKLLFDNDITFRKISAGKLRRLGIYKILFPNFQYFSRCYF